MDLGKDPNSKLDHYIEGNPIDPVHLTHPMKVEDWFKVGDIVANDPWSYVVDNKRVSRMLKVRRKILDLRDEWLDAMAENIRRICKVWPYYYVPRKMLQKLIKELRETKYGIFEMLAPKFVRWPLHAYMLHRYFSGSIYDTVFDPIMIYWLPTSVTAMDVCGYEELSVDYMQAIKYIEDWYVYRYTDHIYKHDKYTRIFIDGDPGRPYPKPKLAVKDIEKHNIWLARYEFMLRNIATKIFTMYWYDKWSQLLEQLKDKLKDPHGIQHIAHSRWVDRLFDIGKESILGPPKFIEFYFPLAVRSEILFMFTQRGFMAPYVVLLNPKRCEIGFDNLRSRMAGGMSFLDIPFGPIGADYYVGVNNQKDPVEPIDEEKWEKIKDVEDGFAQFEPENYRAEYDDDFEGYWSRPNKLIVPKN